MIAQLEKEDKIQMQSHNRKKKIYDQLGKIADEMVKDES